MIGLDGGGENVEMGKCANVQMGEFGSVKVWKGENVEVEEI